MKANQCWKSAGAFLALAVFCGSPAGAQEAAAQKKDASAQAIVQKAGPGAYQASRESILSGKILSYSASSTSAPLGARISLQTSSGALEVHAGNAKLIATSNLSLKAGDSVTITGETVPFGTKEVFVARVIQKGTQSLIVRSKNGTPLLPISRDGNGNIVAPGGVR
jgi:hypothetical protein